MNIDPEIMHRHLHEAGVEQVRRDFQRQGYAIDPVESGIDVVARLGRQTVAAQVKVLGAGLSSESSMTAAMTEARRLGASFRLFVIKPERETVVEIDRLGDSLLEAARRNGAEALGFPAGWTIESMDHVVTDRVVIHPHEIEISGQAYAFLRGNAEEEGTPIAFKLLLDGDRRVLDGSEIEPLDD